MALADAHNHRLGVMLLQQHRPYFRHQAQPKMIEIAGVDDKDALRADPCSDTTCRMPRAMQNGWPAAGWLEPAAAGSLSCKTLAEA